MYCNTNEGFGIGCGNGFGFFIDKSLLRGITSRCDTFDNDLLSAEKHFNIKNIEIWGLKM